MLRDVYGIEPIIDPPGVIDQANPLQEPFRIASNATLLTLRNVTPTCRVEYAEWPDGLRVANQEVAGLEEWGDIPPGHPTFYRCPVSIGLDYTKLFMLIDVYYELEVPILSGIFPSLYWPRIKTFRFQVRTDSRGARSWLAGYDLTGDLGHMVPFSVRHDAEFVAARRHPRRLDNPPKGIRAVSSGQINTGSRGISQMIDGTIAPSPEP